MSKRALWSEKTWYNEPPKPTPGKPMAKVELLTQVADRACYYRNSEDEYYYEDDEEVKDFEDISRPLSGHQTLSLKEINDLVAEEKLDPAKVYVTGSFADDYLQVQVIHVAEMTDEEKEALYQKHLAGWQSEQEHKKKEELRRIEYQMEALRRQQEDLKKK